MIGGIVLIVLAIIEMLLVHKHFPIMTASEQGFYEIAGAVQVSIGVLCIYLDLLRKQIK